jgi:hypothetical protein
MPQPCPQVLLAERHQYPFFPDFASADQRPPIPSHALHERLRLVNAFLV